MLNYSILDVFQVLDGVDALSPVFAHVCQGALDVFDINQGTVQLRQPGADTVQLGLDGCLKEPSTHTGIKTLKQPPYNIILSTYFHHFLVSCLTVVSVNTSP